MKTIDRYPAPPSHFSAEEKDAWLRGYNDKLMSGDYEESLNLITPYDVDEEAALYEAWEVGCDAAG